MYTFCNIVKDSIILYEFDKRRSLVEVLHRDSEGVVRKERKKKKPWISETTWIWVRRKQRSKSTSEK